MVKETPSTYRSQTSPRMRDREKEWRKKAPMRSVPQNYQNPRKAPIYMWGYKGAWDAEKQDLQYT